MPTPFAILEQRLGAATVASLANAQMLVAGQPAVDGIFDRAAAVAGGIEPVGLHSVRSSFCCAAALAVPVAEGAPVIVQYGGSAQTFVVANRVDLPHVGQSLFDLRRAA